MTSSVLHFYQGVCLASNTMLGIWLVSKKSLLIEGQRSLRQRMNLLSVILSGSEVGPEDRNEEIILRVRLSHFECR